jgi:hypothetical protein
VRKNDKERFILVFLHFISLFGEVEMILSLRGPLLFSSPRPRRAGGIGGGGAAPDPGGAILSSLPRLGIAGRVVMGADFMLLLLKVWDHGTKGGGPGWR